MSFTRFHDDPCRIHKQLEESTFQGRYMLNKPGNGAKPCYMEDPFIRLQKWGGNLRKNNNGPIEIHSYLIGLKKNIETTRQTFKEDYNTITNQSRTTNPAWLYKDLEQNHRYILLNKNFSVLKSSSYLFLIILYLS